MLIVGDIVALTDGAPAGSNRLLVCRLEGLGNLPGDPASLASSPERARLARPAGLKLAAPRLRRL
ncbi:MAG TPA: hypothetical protein VIZ32_09780, partial [Vicinamibacterales bacterium]